MKVGSSCIVGSHLLARLTTFGIHRMNDLHMVLSNRCWCFSMFSSIGLCQIASNCVEAVLP